MSEEDIKNLPIGTKITTNEEHHNVYIKYNSQAFTNEEYDDIEAEDLRINDNDEIIILGWSNKVVKIETPSYEIKYKREAKKMTLKEICEALGYEVEIVKEK